MTEDEWHTKAMRLAGYMADAWDRHAPYHERMNTRDAFATHLHNRPDDAAIARDAARYRWLRDEDNAIEQLHVSALVLPHGQELDATIDALLSEKEPK